MLHEREVLTFVNIGSISKTYQGANQFAKQLAVTIVC